MCISNVSIPIICPVTLLASRSLAKCSRGWSSRVMPTGRGFLSANLTLVTSGMGECTTTLWNWFQSLLVLHFCFLLSWVTECATFSCVYQCLGKRKTEPKVCISPNEFGSTTVPVLHLTATAQSVQRNKVFFYSCWCSFMHDTSREDASILTHPSLNIFFLFFPLMNESLKVLCRLNEMVLFACWLLNLSATCQCISGMDLLRQLRVL